MPYDIALCGNDDIELFSYVRPRISTVSLPKHTMGAKCAELLVNLIQSTDNQDDSEAAGESNTQITLNPELLIRTTA